MVSVRLRVKSSLLYWHVFQGVRQTPKSPLPTKSKAKQASTFSRSCDLLSFLFSVEAGASAPDTWLLPPFLLRFQSLIPPPAASHLPPAGGPSLCHIGPLTFCAPYSSAPEEAHCSPPRLLLSFRLSGRGLIPPVPQSSEGIPHAFSEATILFILLRLRCFAIS